MTQTLRSSIKGALNRSIKPGLLKPAQFRGSTLDLDFAGTKSLKNQIGNKDVVTFTRASSGTYVDGDGVIQSAAVNTPRFDHDPATGESLGLLVEEARTNVIAYSDDLSNAWWNPIDTLTASIAASNPFNYSQVYRVRANTTNNDHRIYRSDNTFLSANINHTFSLFAAPEGTGSDSGMIQLRAQFLGTSAAIVNFNLNTGQVNAQDGTSGTGSTGATWSISDYGIEPFAGGWYRVWMTYQASATSSVGVTIIDDINASDVGGIYSYTGSGTGGSYLAGIQVEQGSFRTSVIPTSGSTVTRAADVAEITGANFAKTNLLPYSDIFAGSLLPGWATNLARAIPATSVAPDGSTNGVKVTTTGNGGLNLNYQVSGLTTGKTYTVSGYLKGTPGEQIYFVADDVAGSTVLVTFNGEWQRISGTFVHGGGTAYVGAERWNRADVNNPLPDVTFEAWGYQIEEGSVLTEYTPSIESFDSRASSATYVDDTTGLIKTTPVNLFLQSQTFGSGSWTKTGVSVTTASIDSPFDTSTVYQMTATATPNYLLQNSTDLVANGTYTQSVFAKAGSSNFIQLAPSGGFVGQPTHVNFELTGEGTVGTNTTGGVASIEKVGNDGWYRVTLVATRDSTNTATQRILFAVTNSLTGGRLAASSGSVYIWGAQIEEGSTATPYIRTTSTISGAARYENGELLLEEARTNKVRYSEDFSNAVWSKLNSGASTAPVVTANYTVGPDGITGSATRLQASISGLSNNDYSLIQQGIASSSNDYGSIWVKSNTGSDQTIYFRALGTDSTNTAVATTEWTRIGQYSTATIVYITVGLRGSATGPASVDISIWGAQLEEGSYATSYIPTSGSTVTRAADVSTSALGVDSFYNQTEGTVFAETEAVPLSNAVVASFSDGSLDNRIEVRSVGTSAANSRTAIVENGVVQSITETLAAGNDYRKIALRYGTNDTIAATDGTLSPQDSSVTVPTVNNLYLGNNLFETTKRPGHIKRLSYFNTRLPDATLQTITT